MASTSGLNTPAGAARAYRVLLGREAESEAVLAEAARHPVEVMVAGLLSSGELHEVLVAPLLSGAPPLERFAEAPEDQDRAWASEALPLTPEGRTAAQAAQRWRDLLLAIYGDARFGATVDALNLAWSREALVTALTAWADAPQDEGRREDDWGDSIAERRASMMRDVAERLRFVPPELGAERSGPLISVLTPVYQSPLEYLVRAIDSVRAQTQANWELILVDDGSPKPTVRSLLAAYAALDDRIRVRVLPQNAGIAAASNAGLEMARGAWLALLDHDDMLTRDALAEVAAAIRANPDVDFLYSDEAFIGEDDAPQELFPKPDWSPLLMLNMHYVSHLTVHRTAKVRELGGFRSAYDFSQDYDLVLRVADGAPKVVHIDRVLYGWRRIEGSAAQGGKDFARAGNVAAVQDALDRRGWGGVAEALPTANRVRRRPRPAPSVAVIIPSDDAANITAAVRSILDLSWWDRLEVLVVTTSALAAALRPTLADPRLRWVGYDRTFNFSDKCNAGAAATEADYLVFYNDDVRVISPDWIENLLEVATLPEVGVTGAKLLYENGTLQHAGMVTAVQGLVGTALHKRPADSHEWLNIGAQSVREVSVICGALLMISRAVFEQVGGFDAVDAPVSHSDVDLCLRVQELGLSCVYTPHAVLRHIGHASLGAEASDGAAAPPKRKDKADVHLLRRHAPALVRDPYFPEAVRGLLHRDSQARWALHPGAGPQLPPAPGKRDVLLVSHDLSASGAPKLVLDMARVLRADGNYVAVISAGDGPMRAELQADGVPVMIDGRLLGGEPPASDPALAFDLVIANTAVTWPVVRRLAPRMDVRWYVHETELLDTLAASQPLFTDTLSRPRELWAGSGLAREALARLGAEAQLLSYGVDDPGPQPPPSGDRVRIGVFGAYEPRKGQDLALAAWRLLPEELRDAAELRMFGRVLDPAFHAALLAEAQGEPGVTVGGELTREAYRAELAACHIVLVPSRDDTLPLVSLDALAAGRVLACSRRVGTSAWLEPRVSGLVSDLPEPPALAALLAPAIADPGLRARVGEGARVLFLEAFTVDAFARRLLARLEPVSRPPLASLGAV